MLPESTLIIKCCVRDLSGTVPYSWLLSFLKNLDCSGEIRDRDWEELNSPRLEYTRSFPAFLGLSFTPVPAWEVECSSITDNGASVESFVACILFDFCGVIVSPMFPLFSFFPGP